MYGYLYMQFRSPQIVKSSAVLPLIHRYKKEAEGCCID
jgi:hypothetical protein